MTESSWTLLRSPFPSESIGKLPRSTCRACSESRNKRCEQHTWVYRCPECHSSHSSATIHLDFVGHADVTDRLLQVDPEWTWEPFALDESGLPAFDRGGNLWIKLTILGVTRPGVGDGKSAKECIGDAIRNAAMRFGVALDLWAKGDRSWSRTSDETPQDHEGNPNADLINEVARLAQRLPEGPQGVVNEWADSHDGQHIKDATDVGGLELLRDDLAERVRQQEGGQQ